MCDVAFLQLALLFGFHSAGVVRGHPTEGGGRCCLQRIAYKLLEFDV